MPIHEDLSTALLNAASSGDEGGVSRLLAAGADPDAFAGAALNAALEAGHLGIVGLILRAGADPESYPTPTLHLAATTDAGNPTLELLLMRGLDPNHADFEGITPLFPASGRRGSAHAVRVLLAAGADPNHRCDDGDTPLIWAASQRPWEPPGCNPLTLLIAGGADVNFVNDRQSVPANALLAAAERGYYANVYYLLDGGADVNVRDSRGNTALILAAGAGHLLVAELLLNRGAAADVRNLEGLTPAMAAARHCDDLLNLLR
jgi:ankyrin repeat protein